MNSRSGLEFRLGLAPGFLSESEQDYGLKRWRSCVDSSQLAVENCAKAVLILFGVTSKTHDPARVVSKLIQTGVIAGESAETLKPIIADMLTLGSDEHFLTDYGDEMTLTLPWDLFTEESAQTALAIAR